LKVADGKGIRIQSRTKMSRIRNTGLEHCKEYGLAIFYGLSGSESGTNWQPLANFFDFKLHGFLCTSELLKDSQYLTENIDINNLTTTVSGALDR
jgi:hypothetical protein